MEFKADKTKGKKISFNYCAIKQVYQTKLGPFGCSCLIFIEFSALNSLISQPRVTLVNFLSPQHSSVEVNSL